MLLFLCFPTVARVLPLSSNISHTSLFFQQWKPGDPEPTSWKKFYRYSPCVPTDYSTIAKAMELCMAPCGRRGKSRQVRDIRILLRPGTFGIYETIILSSRYKLTLETIDLPAHVYTPAECPIVAVPNAPPPPPEGPLVTAPPPRRRQQRRQRLRRLLACAAVPDEGPVLEWGLDESTSTHDGSDTEWDTTRATLVFGSLVIPNQPVLWLQQGSLVLRNVDIFHFSLGLDIWNGNAALQIQPPDEPTTLASMPHPECTLDGVRISSTTGRGIVNIDGGSLCMTRSAVHDCAATGLYIGGNSVATLCQTDVVRNGVGGRNAAHATIARGHSGVYLEQGQATIQDCNISSNTLTGISAVSPSNAILELRHSDLMGNGTHQLEMPSRDTVAYRESVLEQNTLSIVGRGRVRSGLGAVAAWVPRPVSTRRRHSS